MNWALQSASTWNKIESLLNSDDVQKDWYTKKTEIP